MFKLPIETIGTKFGGIPERPAAFSDPGFRADLILPLLPSALTVALLAAVESLLSAVVADSMTGDRHNSNAELMAQGVANLVVSAGGRYSGDRRHRADCHEFSLRCEVAHRRLVHAATLLVIVLLSRRWRVMPLATLAAVLFVVAYNMGEWREIGASGGSTGPTIGVDDHVRADRDGRPHGRGRSRHGARGTPVHLSRHGHDDVATVTPEYIEEGPPHVLQDKDVPDYVTILRIHGPFLFGMTDKLADATDAI